MKFDLIRPCENCPFSTGAQRITFQGRERAEEIEEQAYREGFVCHEHADCVEDDEYLLTPGGYYPRLDGTSQHCFGALYMYLRQGSASVPWEHAIAEDPALEERWWQHLTLDQIAAANKLVWEDEEAFFAANEGDQ